MQKTQLVWLVWLTIKTTMAVHYNYTCKFALPDNELYDLSALRNTHPPDYTYKDSEYMFVVNFCGPTFKRCYGVEESFVSLWNSSTYDCIVNAAENDPEVRYIDSRNLFKGIEIYYKHGMSFTKVIVTCDQGYDKAAFMRAERVHVGYILYFKSKHVCRNFAMPITDHWSGVAILLVLILLVAVLYLGCGLFVSLRRGSYRGCLDAVPHKELFLRLILQFKQCFNRLIGTGSEETAASTDPASSSGSDRPKNQFSGLDG
jgi:hypothetical protein